MKPTQKQKKLWNIPNMYIKTTTANAILILRKVQNL